MDLKCPDCGKEINVFGESHIDEIAKKYGTEVLAKLPIDSEIAKCVDNGRAEMFDGAYLDDTAKRIEEILG